jgi:hypothetical protein
MKNASRYAAALLVSAGIASLVGRPAMADWEGTKWGMSPEEVMAVAPKPLTGPEPGRGRMHLQALVIGHYKAGDFKFDMDFQFDADKKLAMIGLQIIDKSQCDALTNSLKAKYGAPIEHTVDPDGWTKFVWNDPKKSNAVTLHVDDGCRIIYEKLDLKASDKL